MTIKISFALLFIDKFENDKLIFELNSNHQKLLANLFYVVENLKVIMIKRIFDNDINDVSKKFKIDEIIEIISKSENENQYMIWQYKDFYAISLRYDNVNIIEVK